MEVQVGKGGGAEVIAPPEAKPADNPFATGLRPQPRSRRRKSPRRMRPKSPNAGGNKAAGQGGQARWIPTIRSPAARAGEEVRGGTGGRTCGEAGRPGEEAAAAAGKQGKAGAKAESDDPFGGDDKSAPEKPAEKKAAAKKAAGKSGDKKAESDNPFAQ